MSTKQADCCGACALVDRVRRGEIAPEPASDPIRVALDQDGKPVALAVVVTEGPQTGTSFPVSRCRMTIGRRGTDIELSDPALSRVTCALEVTPDGGVFVEDLQSSCGTYVNGIKVRRSGLHERDVVRVGQSALAFRLG